MTSLSVPSNIQENAIVTVQPVVDDLRTFLLSQKRIKTIHPELEIRFCHEGSGGMNEDAWKRLLAALDSFSNWDKKTDFMETVDFYYNVDVDGESVPIRTSRSVSNEEDIGIEHMRKNVVRQTFLSLQGCGTISDSVKVVFSTEESLSEDILPAVTSTTMVRIKHRRSYIWGAWQFDATKTWSASRTVRRQKIVTEFQYGL